MNSGICVVITTLFVVPFDVSVASSKFTSKLYRLYRACCSMYGNRNGAQECTNLASAKLLNLGAGLFTRQGGRPPLADSKLCRARPICLRLLAHFMRAAASRTF